MEDTLVRMGLHDPLQCTLAWVTPHMEDGLRLPGGV